MKGSIPISIIAERSGVSIATVSRILNQSTAVRSATRDRVMRVMEELGYGTNDALSEHCDTLLVLIPDFSNPFYAPIMEGVQQTAHENGFEVLALQTRDIYGNTAALTNLISRGGFKGVLWLSSTPSMELINAVRKLVPSVMCCEYPEGYDGSYVSIDDRAAAFKAVSYLISSGCRRIGFVNCSTKYKYARKRSEGYYAAMEKMGLEIPKEWIISVPYVDYSLAYSAITQQFIHSEQAPDAFFTASDVFAVAALNAAVKSGYRVPEDISVIGFDNVETARMTIPPLATVNQPGYTMGQQSCSILIEKIYNPSLPERRINLDTELIIRDSVH